MAATDSASVAPMQPVVLVSWQCTRVSQRARPSIAGKVRGKFGAPGPSCAAPSPFQPLAAPRAPLQKKAELPFKYKLGSGAVAGVIGTCIIYPIDTVKTYLMQSE